MKKSVLVPSLLVVLSGVFWLTASNVVQADDYAATHPCLLLAHRGFSAVAPENTVTAAKMAAELGADGSEFDVYPSSDNALVVMHDGSVDRTTNGKGKITELTLAEIKKLDAGSWKDPKYKGEPVPTLGDMLTTLKDVRCKPVIEIKGKNIADKVVAAVQAAKMVDHAFIISFNADNIKIARGLEPGIPAALLSELKKMPKDLTQDQQVDWLVNAAKECKTDFLDLDYNMLTADMVAKLHQHKLIVWVWTVDDQQAMDNLIAWGIDGITTNKPDLLQERIKKAGREVK
jgi:glycerophosphoryl diester phosphodiesterase